MTRHDATWHEELQAYRDDELPLLRKGAVRWHLATCAICREEITIMTQISEQLRSMESETFGPDDTLDTALRAKILTSVATAAAPEPATADNIPAPVLPTKWRIPHGREWMALGTCAVIFAVAATTMLQPRLKQGFNVAASAINTSTDGPDTTPDQTTTSVAAPMASSGAGGSAAASNTNYDRQVTKSYPLTESDSAERAANAPASAASNKAQFQQRIIAPSGGKSGLDKLAAIPPGATSTDNMPSSLRRVHKEGRITVAVEQVETQSDAVTQMVKSVGGFVADNALSTGGDGLKTATLSLKVPVKQFETVMGQIARLGDVKAKNIVGEDITEKFSDVEQADRILGSELGVREAQLKAALVLADTKRKKAIPVPWQQRAEVRDLRIQAAQMRARLDLLKKISDLATIEAQIQEKPHHAKQTGFLGDINDNTASALDTFVMVARVPVNLLLWILAYSPLWLPLLVAYFCLQRIYRRA